MSHDQRHLLGCQRMIDLCHLCKHFKYCCLEWVGNCNCQSSWALKRQDLGVGRLSFFLQHPDLLKNFSPSLWTSLWNTLPNLQRSRLGELKSRLLKARTGLLVEEKVILIGIQPASVRLESKSSLEIKTARESFWVWNTNGLFSKNINLTQFVSPALNLLLLVERKICWGSWPGWES